MKPQLRAFLRWWPAALVLAVTAISAGSAAQLQAHNADQLVNGFMFETYQVFHGGIFPLEHTQLLKWPLFALLGVGKFLSALYVELTIALTVTTIAGLLYTLYYICKRAPRAFSILCMLLSSVLLLVPIQVFDGGVTAPLGMTMLTGRNVEYVVYLGVLALYLKAHTIRSWQWASGTALLSLLFASDNLFVYLSLGGALLFGVMALPQENGMLKQLARVWLIGGITAWTLSLLWLTIIARSLTHLVPYPPGYEPVTSLLGIGQGVTGTAQALALNFGLTTRAGVGTWPAFGLNIIVAGLAVYAAIWLVKLIYTSGDSAKEQPAAIRFAAMLLATTLATVSGFALTNQPYLQNARYLSITIFAGLVVVAVWLRTIQLPKTTTLVVVGSCVVTLAMWTTVQHNNELSINDTLAERNQKIAVIVQRHHVEFLTGSYWRVVPIRALAPTQAIMPLQGCLQKTPVLTSSAWRPDLLTHSFAYLLTAQSSGVPQQTCSRQLLEQQYGKPTSEIIIAGSDASPKETLLFYDAGAAAKTLRLAE